MNQVKIAAAKEQLAKIAELELLVQSLLTNENASDEQAKVLLKKVEKTIQTSSSITSSAKVSILGR